MRIKRWDEVCSTGDTDDIVASLAYWHLTQVPASELRASVVVAVFNRNYDWLCELEVRPDGFDLDQYRHYSQVLAFFKKRQDICLTGVDRDQVARQKWRDAECACRETNTIFKAMHRGEFFFSSRVNAILYRAQRKIAYVLGDVPSLAELPIRFGPGATTQVKKRDACARVKLGAGFQCSEDLIPVLPDLFDQVPGWFTPDQTLAEVDIVYSRVAFVPKTAKTDRSIAIEPVLNSMLQLGIGDYMADRLKRVGCDITDQSRNQQLARVGSLTGALATLDLSSASDTVSVELVRSLLSPEWFDLLSYFRTSTVRMDDGSLHRLEKFSSMGNGFTFPLETLIFWALASSASEGVEDDPLTVAYGDDIIVSVAAVPRVCEILHVCGFSVNMEKSFWSGPFRESCGADYYLGTNVRPVFVKNRLSGADVFRLHNFYLSAYPDSAPRDTLISYLSPQVILWGPPGYGDGHLHSEDGGLVYDYSCRRRGWGGCTFETYTWKKRHNFDVYPGDHVLPCYSIYEASGYDNRQTSSLTLPADEPSSGESITVPREETLFPNGTVTSLSYESRGGEIRFRVSKVRYRNGRLGVTVPGRRGYKRIMVYIFKPM